MQKIQGGGNSLKFRVKSLELGVKSEEVRVFSLSFILGSARRIFLPASVATTATLAAQAGLVARWDFNNYDSENPTSAAILAPTVGSLAAIPCTGNGSSTEVTDGTLGSITVVNTGLPEGDYALAIPEGAHLKIPLPSGIVRDKSWMLRVRFYDPTTSQGVLRTLVASKINDPTSGIWYISNKNLIQGKEGIFGTADEENKNTTGNIGKQKTNGMTDFRLVSSDAWHSFTAHFGPTGASSTLDGYRSVSLADTKDIRSNFTGDGFLLCAGGIERLMYISSVEVWDDMPLYHNSNYISMSSATLFSGCTLDDIRDLYLTVKGLGQSGGGYARVMSSWEHIVTDDGAGNATDLKLAIRNKNGKQAVLFDFTNSGTGVAGNSLGFWYGLNWASPYFNADGSYVTTANSGNSGTAWDTSGTTSPNNLYALPFRPLDGSLNWSMQMGTGKFGNPVLSVVGDNPTLTFDAAPQADSLTLDCGRGDGAASVTFAYGNAGLKTMSGLGDLNIGRGVSLIVPSGVSIAGELTFEEGAKLTINIAGESHEIDDVLFTATEGIDLPAGKTIADVAGGCVKLSADRTQILYTQTEWTLDANKDWSTLRNGATLASDEIVRITVTGGSKNHTLTVDEDVDIGQIRFVDGSSAILKVATGCTLEADSITGLGFPWVDSGAMLYVDGTVDATSLKNDGTVVKRVAGDVSIPINNDSTGTTIVSNGTLKVSKIYKSGSGTGHEIRVVSGATFDANGVEGVTANVLLEGGAQFVNAGGHIHWNKTQTHSLTLEGDASTSSTANFGLVSASNGETSLALNSHTLTLRGTANFIMANTSVTGTGKVVVNCETLVCYNGVRGDNWSLEVEAGKKLWLYNGGSASGSGSRCDVVVSNFVNRGMIETKQTTGTLTVNGTLTPGNAIPDLALASGATVKATGTAQTVSTAFAASGTITVDASAITKEQLKDAGKEGISVLTVPANYTYTGVNWNVDGARVDRVRAKWRVNEDGTKTLYIARSDGFKVIVR